MNRCQWQVRRQQRHLRMMASTGSTQWQPTLRSAPTSAGACYTLSQQVSVNDVSVLCRKMLDRGGSTVDAAIAAVVCVGVHNAQSTGIAGSSFMLINEV